MEEEPGEVTEGPGEIEEQHGEQGDSEIPREEEIRGEQRMRGEEEIRGEQRMRADEEIRGEQRMRGEESMRAEESEEEGEVIEKEELKEDALEDEINVTDSQVMIQLKEAEEEAEALRKEIARLKAEIDDYQCRQELTIEDEEHLQDIQLLLMEKIALLDALTKKIAKLMEFASRMSKGEETTILDEDEEEEGFPDDLLPRVVICSSWDDMMPKVVVCMDMKKPGAAKKVEEDRDENGLTPEQREALEQERRCMAEERNRLQYQIACLEGEMRVMVRENDLLSKKITQLKGELDNQPPFEFEMSVSATQPPGVGCPKPGNIDMGYGVMGPNANNNYTMGAALSPGAEVQGTLAVSGPVPQPMTDGGRQPRQLPCGVNAIPGKSVPCPKLQTYDQPVAVNPPNDWTTMIPPYGKKCRKDFNASQGCCDNCQGCNQLGDGGYMSVPPNYQDQPSFLPPGFLKQPPMDVNFKVNVQPQSGPNYKPNVMDTDVRSNRIAQQLQEIELELRRMQRDLCKAKKDKETLKAQQATLNCAKNYIM